MTHTDRQHCSFTGTDMCGVISDLLLPETVIISNDNNNNYTFLSVLNHYFLLFFYSTYIFKVLYSLSLSLNVCVCVTLSHSHTSSLSVQCPQRPRNKHTDSSLGYESLPATSSAALHPQHHKHAVRICIHQKLLRQARRCVHKTFCQY